MCVKRETFNFSKDFHCKSSPERMEGRLVVVVVMVVGGLGRRGKRPPHTPPSPPPPLWTSFVRLTAQLKLIFDSVRRRLPFFLYFFYFFCTAALSFILHLFVRPPPQWSGLAPSPSTPHPFPRPHTSSPPTDPIHFV